MGFFSGLIAIGSAIVSTLSTVGSFIVDKLPVVATVIESIAKVFGAISPEQDIETLGAKALQSDLKPEDYDNVQEYITAISQQQLDPEKLKDYTLSDKLGAGTMVATLSLQDKLQLSEQSAVNLLKLAAIDKGDYLNNERFTHWKEAGVDIEKSIAYFSGNLNAKDSLDIEKRLLQEDTKLYADKNEAEFEKIYDSIQSEVEKQV